MVSRRILYVAYPLLTVSEESAGGAEQVLCTLEREMALQGAETTVAASRGSCVAGALFNTGEPCRDLDDFDRRNAEHQDRILELIGRRGREGKPFDMVHDMSGSFWPRACESDVPLLATLHLPRSFYAPRLFKEIPGNVRFNCVSVSQASAFTDVGRLAALNVVTNGIALDRYSPNIGNERRSRLMWLGRICEEKAPHLALAIAEEAQMPITLAGQVYPFSCHQQYFDREVAPRVRRLAQAGFVRSPSTESKRRLLRQARAVVITSQVDETSSLVAMEAAASGTPVIAFARGALPEIVADGVTGFFVDGTKAAVLALRRLAEIDPETCARYAREHFSSAAMAENYAELYAGLLAAKI